jgi:hypothetical protein
MITGAATESWSGAEGIPRGTPADKSEKNWVERRPEIGTALMPSRAFAGLSSSPIDVARRAVPLDCVLSRWRQRRAEMGLLTRDDTNRRGPGRVIVGFEADGARADGDFVQHEGRDTHRLTVDEHTRAHWDGVDRQGSIKPGTRNRAARRGRGRDRCINSARSRFDPYRCDRFLVVGEAHRDKRGGVCRPLNRCGGLDGGWCRGWRNDRLRRSHRRWGGYLHKDHGHQHTSTRGAHDDSP